MIAFQIACLRKGHNPVIVIFFKCSKSYLANFRILPEIPLIGGEVNHIPMSYIYTIVFIQIAPPRYGQYVSRINPLMQRPIFMMIQ